MRQAVILLAFVSALAYVSTAQAECCRASLTLSYGVQGGTCADAGGHSGTRGCTITICADGRAQIGTFCGRGSCNIFGCACKNGCIRGNWQGSFRDINRHLRLTVTDARWNT